MPRLNKREIKKYQAQIEEVKKATEAQKKKLPKKTTTEVDGRTVIVPADTETRTKVKEFVEVELTGSKGRKYIVAVPRTVADHTPKYWEWTTTRYQVAEMIAQGIPITQIVADPSVNIKTRMSIYGWLEHPEFREHVDALVLESGFASKRERIAGISRVTKKIFDKIIHELDGVPLTDKSVGAVLQALHTFAKHIAQEKEEFVESQKVEQQTNITGAVAVGHIQIDNMLKERTEDERKNMERDFNNVADEIIRNLTGSSQ
jgi:hypothetical protein